MPLDEVSNLINYLSNDDDVRQDLWVHYLSGQPVESLNARLIRIKAEHIEDSQLQKAIWDLFYNPLSVDLTSLIQTNFSNYERSIICCLMLGLDIGQISDIKGISEVRIEQTIETIRYNHIWTEYKSHSLKDEDDTASSPK